MTEAIQNYGMGTDWRGRQVNEWMMDRNLPLNELNALRTGTQIQAPQQTPFQGSMFSSPDFAGSEQEQYNRNLYQQQRTDDRKSQMRQGLFDLAGSAISVFGG